MKRALILGLLITVILFTGLVMAVGEPGTLHSRNCDLEKAADVVYYSPTEGYINYFPLEVGKINNEGQLVCKYGSVPVRQMRFYAPEPTFTPNYPTP